MSDLVQRLSDGDHPIEVALRPERTSRAFEESLDRGFVHIRFTDTRGGTEVGVRVDEHSTQRGDADFDHGTGSVDVIGTLTLDFVKVRCIAHVEVASLAGTGRLQVLPE